MLCLLHDGHSAQNDSHNLKDTCQYQRLALKYSLVPDVQYDLALSVCQDIIPTLAKLFQFIAHRHLYQGGLKSPWCRHLIAVVDADNQSEFVKTSPDWPP